MEKDNTVKPAYNEPPYNEFLDATVFLFVIVAL